MRSRGVQLQPHPSSHCPPSTHPLTPAGPPSTRPLTPAGPPAPPGLSPGVQKASLSEYARLVAELKKIVDTVDVKEPWKTPNAAELDATTFQSW